MSQLSFLTTQLIYLWPDGFWVLAEDYCETELSYRGYDIARLNLPADWDLDQIEWHCQDLINC